MANTRKYANKEEYEKAMQEKRREWNKANYKRLVVLIPPEFADWFTAESKRIKTPKRQIVMEARKKYFENH